MTDYTRNDRRKKRRSKKILKTILITIIVAFLALGGGIVYFVKQLQDTAAGSYNELKRGDKSAMRAEPIDIDKDNFSVLLLGSDAREGEDMENTRTDSMIVATFNKAEHSVILTSIPRDSYVELAGLGIMDKINHASAKGDGVDSTIETVEKLLDIPIDYHALINFAGLERIVDELGGVDVDVTYTFDFTEGGRTLHFKEGPATLDGEHALAYSRERKSDLKGDLGRGQRQQQVIKAIIQKATSFSSITRFQGVMDAIGDNLRTDLQFGHLLSLHGYAGSLDNIEMLQLEGDDMRINDIYYLGLYDESLAEVKQRLHEHLEWTPKKPVHTSGY
ncbi:LCP family protein [Bacillus sp. FSL W7-1360]